MNRSYSKRHQHLVEELANVGQLYFKSAIFENDYIKHFEDSNLFRYRVASVVAVVALVGFMIQDLNTFPEESITSYLVIRVGICIPLFVISFFISLIPSMHRQIPYWMVSSVLMLGLGNVIVVAVNYANNHISPYEGIILTVIGSHFLIGLNFRAATLCSLVILFSYLFSVLIFHNNEQGIYNLGFVFSTVVICVVGSYEVEKQLRINFIKNEILTILSERDGLTGIYNRSSLDKKLRHIVLSSIREKQGVVVALIDVDFFKSYNDHYGHIEGDECLRSIAVALQNCCHRPSDFCARYGGEEFVIVWNPTKPYAPETLIENIQQEISDLLILHEASDISDQITLSGGVIYFEPTQPISNDDIFEKIDKALYDAKGAGRNQFIVILGLEDPEPTKTKTKI